MHALGKVLSHEQKVAKLLLTALKSAACVPGSLCRGLDALSIVVHKSRSFLDGSF